MSKFPSNRCTISDDWKYKGMRVIWMENDLLRIGILAGRGSDIFEFRYKPQDVNFLLRLPKDIINPQRIFSQLRNTSNQMEDYYYGGWQEALPNSAPFIYRNASLGQHGEVWMIPWKHAILESGPDKVSVKFWTQPLRVPITIEKILTLEKDSNTLIISEIISNESNTDLDIMWGHHIAFGLPFLQDGALIDTNAQNFIAETNMPILRRYKPGVEFKWPDVLNVDGNKDRADKIPPKSAPPYSDLAYLSGFDNQAFYALKNEKANLGFGIKWDGSVFKSLWYWQERYATQDAPWWGDAYAVGLEPWTSSFRTDPQQAIDDGDLLRIKARESISTSLQAIAFEGTFII